MPGQNLTKLEAHERAELIRVDGYVVEIDLTGGQDTFAVVTDVRFGSRPGAATFLDLIADSVESVELNGRLLDPREAYADSRVQLPHLASRNHVRIESTQRYTNTGEGLHRFVDPVDGEVYLHTQFEVPDSRRVFAVFEQPDLKATFEFSVVAPARWQVVSNQSTPVPVLVGDRDGEDIARWAFAPTPVVSSYITALIAGPYAAVRSEWRSRDGRRVPLGVFCRRSLEQHLVAEEVFATTREGLAFFEDIFGYPYPFEKYDQLFVPELSAGAMENAGAVTFDEEFLFRGRVSEARREGRAVTILHELAHMWFGNLVTMRWWDDLWLNESFADYVSILASVEAAEWTHGWATFAASDKAWAYRQDQLPSTHPVAGEVRDLEDVLNNFDGITYAKGASALKQLVAWVGRESFLLGVHDYFVAHQYANAGLRDFLHHLEARSGRDLARWSALWLETAGVNTLRAEFELDGAGRFSSFHVRQTASHDQPTLRPHRLAIGLYDDDGVSIHRVGRIEIDVEGALTAVPELVGVARPDLLVLNEDDLTYAKIRMDERSLRSAEGGLATIESPVTRALIWGTLWDATRDAEYPASRFVQVVLANAAGETHSGILRLLLGQLFDAVSTFVPPEGRRRARADAAEAVWALATRAQPGSDAQLQFGTAFLQLAVTADQLDVIAALGAGTVTVSGFTIDTDMHWTLLTTLAAGGRVTQTMIDTQLAADPTASGERAAARVRAALPSFEDKARAWSAAFGSGEESNLMIEAIGEGFLEVEDASVLEPFTERFFTDMLPAWESRGHVVAEQLSQGFYPHPLASPELARATRRWLDETPEAPHGLRRLIEEHLADVERALAAQRLEAAVLKQQSFSTAGM